MADTVVMVCKHDHEQNLQQKICFITKFSACATSVHAYSGYWGKKKEKDHVFYFYESLKIYHNTVCLFNLLL